MMRPGVATQAGGGTLRATFLAALGLLTLAPAPLEAAPQNLEPTRSKPRFSPLDSSGVQSFKLFDLGVTDANRDGNLDVFTINHKFDSSLLLGDGTGGLVESTAALGLNPTAEFPGLESIRRDPVQSAPGLYIYATDRVEPRDPLHIDAVDVPASGQLTFASQDLRVESSGGAIVTQRTAPDGKSVLSFTIQPGQAIDLSVDHIDLPIDVAIDPPIDPAAIRIGADAVAASVRSFQLNLRDRHGYAFGDFDSDGATDLFVASGGLGGDIEEPFFTPFARDEVLLARSGRYLNATAESGFVKGDCRGRQADVADIDGDGDLDLLQTCAGEAPRVHAGDGTGGFTPIAGPPAPGTVHRLVDLAGGRLPELLVADGGQIIVWSSVGGTWTATQQVVAGNGEQPIEGLSLGDLDGDGDLDVIAASAGGNTVLLNDDGTLISVAPSRLGLPRTARAASFVDFDNDGDLDVHLVPAGLYEQVEGRFKRTGSLELRRRGYAYVIDNWADLDNDGRRDLLVSRGRDEFAASQEVDLRRNRTKGGHWLELDLVGPRGNAEAIGARVRVDVGSRSIYGWVGQNDDARQSTGHYRLYFGLGVKRGAKRVVVSWPDGTKRTLGQTRGDRVLRLPFRGAVTAVR